MILDISLDEILHCESYYKMVDYHYNGQNNLPAGIVHVDIQAIPEFFSKINENGQNYIVVSSRSDFSLCYQKQYPPWADLGKWVLLMADESNEYKDFVIPARLNKKYCKLDDKYSIKCYSYTSHTFNEIPTNIKKWYLTNCRILDDKKLINLPFGVNCTDGNKNGIEEIFNFKHTKNRDKLLYINFSNNTYKRAEIKQFYKLYDFITIKQQINSQEYLSDLSTHKFCLCPNGNGVDCYRTWEALYMGCIPIVELNEVTANYAALNLPIIFADTLYGLWPSYLEESYNQIISNINNYSWNTITKSYWQNKINSLSNKVLL